MANQQYTISNSDRSDGSAFAVPGDEDGGVGDDSYQVDQDAGGEHMWTYAHIENGWDVNVDVTLQGSHTFDETITAPVDDGSAETISNGSNGAFDTNVAHSYVQVNVDPAATPTSGDLTVTFQTRED